MNRKNLLPLVLATFAGVASAQSSITLFGVADAAVRRAKTDGVGSITSLVSGSYSSARFGFRGVEDLGGGLSASFWLESFLSQDSGAVTPPGFQRRSTVSLASRELGEVRLGRDYTPTHSSWSRYDPFGYVGVGSVQLLVLSATGDTPVTYAFGSNPNTLQRVSNGIQYFLPRNSWGVDGQFVHAAREGGTPANDQHQTNGARIGITQGKFSVSLAHMKTHNNITIGYFKDSVAAGSFDAGLVRLSGGLRRLEYQTARQDTYLLAAVVPLGVHELKASWNRADLSGSVRATSIEGDRADQYAVGYVYNMSKRSRLYATYATIHNKGNSRFVVPGAPAGPAGATSQGLEFGINHEF